MTMPAVKHLDPLIGVDLHLIVPPGLPPIPIPHPHVGIVFDPFDYLPVLGSTVKVNGLHRAQAGTAGLEVPPHFPIGGAFLKPPSNDNETFMGSATVVVDGEPFTRLTMPVLSCQDLGTVPPTRRKPGTTPRSLVLPTTIALSIPAGPPVIVGGPPTVSLAGVLSPVAMSALFKGLKKLRKLQKASRKMKALSGRIHKAADKLADKLGLSQRARDRIHKSICTLTGHPVDVATGRVLTDAVDWELPGPIPLKLERNYTSSRSDRASVLGYGWSHSLDLALWTEPGRVVFRAEDGREIEFDTSGHPGQVLPPGGEVWEPIDRLTLRRRSELRWEVETAGGVVHELHGVGASGETQAGLCRVARTRDRAGHDVLYEYDARGRLEWVRDSAGRRILFEHDDEGRLVQVALPHPREAKWVSHNRYVYSEAGDLVAVQDAAGHSARYQYADHLLVKETDRAGLSFHFEYDGAGPAAWCVHTWGDGGIYDHTLVYDKQARTTAVTNSLGHTTTYHANEWGVVVKEVDPLGNETQYEYDEALRKTAEVDPLGHATFHEYDERGNRTKTTGPDGATVTVTYNRLDLPEHAVDALGGQWWWRYDAAGLLVEEVNPLEERRRYEYTQGLLSAVVDPMGERTEFGHDAQKNVSLIRYPTGAEVRRGYDKLGRLTYERDARGGEWHVKHDVLGREVRVEGPTGEAQEKRYDAQGNLLEVRGPLRQVRFGYTGFHQLAFREEARTRVTLGYDREDQLVSVTNEAGDMYRFELDACGQVVREEGFDGAVRQYEYDAAGRLRHLVRPSGQRDDFTHDAAGRLTEVKHSDGTFRRFRYRVDGALVEAENESSRVVFERDALGRVLRERQGEMHVTSRYSPGGARIEVESSLGARQRWLRDALGDTRSLSYTSAENPDAWAVAFERDSGGLELGRRLPGGLVTTWRHDAVGRPLERRILAGGRQHARREYRWRGEDQLASISDEVRGTTEYLHDERGRLVGARSPDGSIQHRAMDTAGNLFRAPGRRDRRYGWGGRLKEADGVRYLHDADGNLIEKQEPGGGKWHYTWDGAGLLREVCRPDGERVRFTYDALARRTSKSVVQRDSRGVEQVQREVRFVWDGQVPLHELSAKEGATTWVFEPESFAPLAKEDRTGRYAVVTDHVGAPTEMYDELGRLAWRMQLDLFGGAKTDVARRHCPWRWPGQYEDPETGLYYNRHRYYDPGLGSFISPDPIGLKGGLEPYAYPADPLVGIDPLGLQKCTKKGRIKEAQLPTRGKVRYVPPKTWHPSQLLPRGPQHGYVDKFKNEWTKGPSRTKGQAFEWDVQRPDGSHWNISLDGKVTH